MLQKKKIPFVKDVKVKGTPGDYIEVEVTNQSNDESYVSTYSYKFLL